MKINFRFISDDYKLLICSHILCYLISEDNKTKF